MHGTTVFNSKGSYGTKGLASSSNVPPGRSTAVSWIDSNNFLYLFGGGTYNYGKLFLPMQQKSIMHLLGYNDLWRYNITSNEWTWISGSNLYSQRGVYGTQGVPSSTNVPGVHASSLSWIDSENTLWLFGGTGLDGSTQFGTLSLNNLLKCTHLCLGILNDLWKYNISSNQWTWMSGSSSIRQRGSYGNQGIPSDSTKPGSRTSSVSWVDSNDTLWLFGGNGLDSAGSLGLLIN